MDNCSLKILELSRSGDLLNIGIRIKTPYDSSVREPKIAIIFENGVEKRRIPLILQSYFPEENLEQCIIFAKYAYNLKYLFYKQPQNEKISFSFEFTYGNEIISNMPFTISSDVKMEVDEKYFITVENDNTFVYELVEPLIEKEVSIFSTFNKNFKNFIKSVFGLCMLALAIVLTPIFLLEGTFALFGLAKKAPKNKKKGILHIINHLRWRINNFSRNNFGISDTKNTVLEKASEFFNKLPIKENRIVFISNRRTDLSGNFEFVYNILKEDKNLDIHFILDDKSMKDMSFKNLIRYGYYFATSKVILVDDFTPLIHKLPKRENTYIIQLWHACGAFKTFGYSRLGKTGGQKQVTPNHRNYDYAIVSSNEISKFYAEGFGISLEKAVATGVPRTDIFFDEAYKEKVQTEFYETYPQLKDKKIILFAPTFRGNGKLSGFYPVDKFDVGKLYEELNGEYAILIKHHPFVKNRNKFPEEYGDYIIDMSENSELNDLLFIADLLITDYSSVVFEAALLDIPMLFYAYDLQRYIATRGFYYEYEKFVPGKIVGTFAKAVDAIQKNDFETEKIETFKTRFFDDLDGKSSQRTVDLIYKALQRNE